LIGWLRGVVLVRDPLSALVILDVGGVGYQLMVSWQTFAATPAVGETCTLWVHTHVREDVLALYGFHDVHEKKMYTLLTSVPQVGPRNAIGVLGGLPLSDLLAAIAEGDQSVLQRIPGVGKRTAERILLDLKDKIEPLQLAVRGKTPTPDPTTTSGGGALHDEAHAVLVNLGWKAKSVESALEKASQQQPPATDLDTVVRRALALLMAR
jgi:Holliday junction DNA helicase RuvA